MKIFSVAIVLAVFIPGLGPIADASWLIDAERFHISVHGQLSCQDCHEEIGESHPHPDPADVNRNIHDFFDSGQCTACHEDTADEIAGGSHAGLKTTPWQRFNNCIACHDPHYETNPEQHAVLGDSSQSKEVVCSRCHEFKAELPEVAETDQTCVRCHFSALGEDPESTGKIADFCLHCHDSAESRPGDWTFDYPLIDVEAYELTPHAAVSCLVCHPDAAKFGHESQRIGDCNLCHLPHAEKVIHDAHTRVTCVACHLQSATPIRSRTAILLGIANFGMRIESAVFIKCRQRKLKLPVEAAISRAIRSAPPPWCCLPKASFACPATRQPSLSETRSLF